MQKSWVIYLQEYSRKKRILFILGVITVEQGRGKAILPANVFCHHISFVNLNMFIVRQALITYLTALGKPKCSLILDNIVQAGVRFFWDSKGI